MKKALLLFLGSDHFSAPPLPLRWDELPLFVIRIAVVHLPTGPAVFTPLSPHTSLVSCPFSAQSPAAGPHASKSQSSCNGLHCLFPSVPPLPLGPVPLFLLWLTLLWFYTEDSFVKRSTLFHAVSLCLPFP